MVAKSKHKQLDLKTPFEQLKEKILSTDIVYFVENYLTVDGSSFNLKIGGYKPFVDIYRYVAMKALEPGSKPVVLVKGRQIGGTTMAAAIECYMMSSGLFGTSSRPPIRVGHFFPTMAAAARYTKTKFDPMMNESRSIPGVMNRNGSLKAFVESKLDTSSPSNNNQAFKAFKGGNQLFIDSTGINGDRMRGLTVDVLMFDEFQDIPHVATGAITKSLTAAQYGTKGEGVQLYFGTPKGKGNHYYLMWQASHQHYYHLRCKKCDELFPLYRPDVNWEEIWLYGFTVKCTKCSHEQDKNEAAQNGKWLPVNGDDPDEYKYIGFHMNQLYIPHFSKEKILSEKPEKNPINSERVYQNEVLGEFFDGEGGLISAEEIHEKCADLGRPLIYEISRNSNKVAYAGFDWGQKGALDESAGKQRGKSYSCGVILTAEASGNFLVEFATRLKKVDLQSKVEVVDEMMKRYSVQLSVGDIGDSNDLTHILQRKYPERFLASRAAPKVIGHIKYLKEIYPKEIVFERNYYIGELMSLLKSGKIRFPYGDYEKITWLISHCCSMDIRVGSNRQGDPVKQYVKGPSPNDGFMALLNAYLAWKYHITQGFTIKQPQFMQFEKALKKKKILAALAYVPRIR